MTDPASKTTKLTDDARKNVSLLPHGPDRHAKLKAIWQDDRAILLEKWINSPELQPPK